MKQPVNAFGTVVTWQSTVDTNVRVVLNLARVTKDGLLLLVRVVVMCCKNGHVPWHMRQPIRAGGKVVIWQSTVDTKFLVSLILPV